jgi:hypothetical protein
MKIYNKISWLGGGGQETVMAYFMVLSQNSLRSTEETSYFA